MESSIWKKRISEISLTPFYALKPFLDEPSRPSCLILVMAEKTMALKKTARWKKT